MSACEKGECPLAALRLFEEMPVVKIKPDTWLITWSKWLKLVGGNSNIFGIFTRILGEMIPNFD